MEDFIIVLCIVLGFIAGGLYQKWSYYRKTGNHIQDLNKCVHRFIIKDVCNLKIDPVCQICGKTLSESKNSN